MARSERQVEPPRLFVRRQRFTYPQYPCSAKSARPRSHGKMNRDSRREGQCDHYQNLDCAHFALSIRAQGTPGMTGVFDLIGRDIVQLGRALTSYLHDFATTKVFHC